MIEKFLEINKEKVAQWIERNEQGGVDIKILPYLKGIEKGFFVEAGALDGLFMSNTKILEDLGWGGLLIEPSYKAVERCKKNRKAPVEECALVSKDYEGDTVMGDFVLDGEFGLGAWSSINRQTYGQQNNLAFKAFITKVKARTLDSIFKERGISKVDFLSLDVEGYELEVLKGIDFTTTDITYMLIEINLRDYKLEDMDNYLAQFGYKNLGCLSGFNENMNGWDGSHNDYIYGRS